ncbi:MAG: PHP domain-containing protein [Phycisphaeraceae bacterium]|nr:PHP domain-containing protein [Phycisphaeraceae bacterium]
MPANQELASTLSDMARMMELLGEDSFRAAAHSRAARAIEGLAGDIETIAADRGALLAIEGIGAKMADKIIEFCTTGVIKEHADLRARVPEGLLSVLEVPGLGPKTVRAMWQQLGITSRDGLARAIEDGSLLTLPRMGEKAVAKIRDALTFAAAAGQRTWLGKARPVADVFIDRLRSLAGVERVEAAGSLRRGRETIGDVDILVGMAADAPPAATLAVGEVFRTTPGVTHVLAAGDSKSSVMFSIDASQGRWQPTPNPEKGESLPPPPPGGPAIQVDLRVLPASVYGAALMYFTGSKEHNVRLRERAIARGMTLNEWGLFPDTHKDLGPPQSRGVTPIAAATEEDVFRALDLPWIPPEVREDRGELDHPRPWALVDLADIKAELHAHTTASDGVFTIEQLAAEARRRGFHTIAVTDHSQSSTIAGGLRPDRLRRHIDAVREANERTEGITILAGSEVDILADGRLDYDDDLLASLDVVVASAHAALTQDPATATRRLLAAVTHPLVHILGHPTGRLVIRRPGLSPDMSEIFAAAREHNVAMEINAHWMRLDLRDIHVRAAVEAGCLIAIDCDVHEGADFDNLRFGVQTARRGWVTADRCINTWPARRLHAWLRAKGRGGQ